MTVPFDFQQLTPVNPRLLVEFHLGNNPVNKADDDVTHLIMASVVRDMKGIAFYSDNNVPIPVVKKNVYQIKDVDFNDAHVVRMLTGNFVSHFVVGDRKVEVVAQYRQLNESLFQRQTASRQHLLEEWKIEVPRPMKIMWINEIPIGWIQIDPITKKSVGRIVYFFPSGKPIAIGDLPLAYLRLQDELKLFAP